MFCANCGKTLKNGATTCPHCGAPIGENRFHGLQYTAVQPTIAPGETEKLTEQFRPYTRTTYMSTGEPEGDVLSRTTYRPVLDEESAPQAEAESAQAEAAQDEALPGEAEPQPEATESESAGVESLFGEPKSDSSAAGEAAASQEDGAQPEAEEKGAEDIVDIDPASIHIDPIKVDPNPAISEESQRILNGEQPLHNERVKRTLLTDKLPFGRKSAGHSLFDEDETEDVPAGDAAPGGDTPAPGAEEDGQSGEEFDFGRKAGARGWNFDYMTIAKYAAVALVIIAVFVGGYLWIDYMISGRETSPIEGVTQALYDEGTAYVATLADDAFRAEMLQLYQSDSLAFLERVDGMIEDAEAMLPESPRENDALFIDAMLHIINNVGNALTVDSMNAPLLAGATAEEQATINTASQNNWQIVQNGIDALSSATTAAGLTSIVNSQTVSTNVQQVEEIPEAEPTPDASQYTSLSRDMQSEEVKAMQERLIELGYLDDSADGIFGNNTLIAVKFFQQDAGFDVDGIASPEVQALLFSEDAPRRSVPSPSPSATAPAESPSPEA